MKLTIGIKTLNEERRIAAALASAVEAARPWQGEIILADSGSTDRTIEIARNFPVKIVQLADEADKSCGAGAQLAFQYARGEYFYLLDGDMDHPVVAGRGRDGHGRAGDPRAGEDRAQAVAQQARASLRLVHGGDAGVGQAVDDRRLGAWDLSADNRHAYLLQ